MSFSDEVNKFALSVKDANEKVVRGTTIALFGAIIRSSPVDEGRFRGNWFASGADPSTRVTNTPDKSGLKTANNMQAVVTNLPQFDTFTLTNNLPYSEIIEFGGYPKQVEKGTKVSKKGEKPARYEQRSQDGFSKQAPQGVVRVNAARFEKLLEKEAAKNNYGRI